VHFSLLFDRNRWPAAQVTELGSDAFPGLQYPTPTVVQVSYLEHELSADIADVLGEWNSAMRLGAGN